MMIEMVLNRIRYQEDRTLGKLILFDGLIVVGSFATLELPWNDNKRNASCIPKGEYLVEPRYSVRFRHHQHVLDVPGRDWILFHVGNWPRNTDGCILLGLNHADIDFDSKLEVANSRRAMDRLNNLLTEQSRLTIL